MGFRTLRPVTVGWRPEHGDGWQQVTVEPAPNRVVARGIIVGAYADALFDVRYTIVCANDWAARSIDLETSNGHELHLRSRHAGAWQDARGSALASLDGCIDLDLQGSPFTNTLPIRRTAMTPATGAIALKMVYVPFDTFEPSVDGQIYRCLEADRRYRYDAADGTFSAEITVDEDGLVVDYPPLFRRTAPGCPR